MDVEEEEDVDAFTRPARKRKKKQSGTKNKGSTKRFKIVLTSAAAASPKAATRSTHEVDSLLETHPLKFEISHSTVDVGEVDEEDFDADLEQQLEDSLSFFQETHEDQSPAYAAFLQERAEKERQKRLQELHQADQRGRREIDALIGHLRKEKEKGTERNLEKYRDRANTEEQQNRQKLLTLYQQKVTHNNNKINQGIKILESRHQDELQQALRHHQLSAQQQRLTEAMASQEWRNTSQQIQSKQQRQLQSFRSKGEDLKARTESDFRRDQEVSWICMCHFASSGQPAESPSESLTVLFSFSVTFHTENPETIRDQVERN